MLKLVKRGKKMTIVFKVSENVKNKMIKYYEKIRREKTPPYAIFQAQEADTIITLYESGKVMFQGISADIDASIWIDLEKKLNNRIIDIKTGKEKKLQNNHNNFREFDKYNTIGSDEVGTGDYFGPIVVTATYVAKDKQQLLNELKVGDSKKINDEAIKKIAPIIMQEIPYSTFILTNEDYNKNYSQDLNMNKIKAILHNKALLNLVNKDLDYDKIIVDQFTPATKYYEYLRDVKNKVTTITFTPKAEDKCLSVACASIISRYIFLLEVAKISNLLNEDVPKGAGEKVDIFAKKLVDKYGIEILNKVAKVNFKNTEKIRDL